MQLDQSFDVARPIDVVWRSFGDLPATASCIPGAEITSVEGNDKASGVFKIQLGPIKAAFAGDAEVTRDDATHSGTISGAGKDGKNATRVKAAVKYQLHPVGESATRVDLSVDYNISGPLAQFSRAGIVKEIAGNITRMFAANLETMLSASEPAVQAPVAAQRASAITDEPETAAIVTEQPAAPPRPAPEPQSLKLGSLLWSMFCQKVRGVFSRKKS